MPRFSASYSWPSPSQASLRAVCRGDPVLRAGVCSVHTLAREEGCLGARGERGGEAGGWSWDKDTCRGHLRGERPGEGDWGTQAAQHEPPTSTHPRGPPCCQLPVTHILPEQPPAPTFTKPKPDRVPPGLQAALASMSSKLSCGPSRPQVCNLPSPVWAADHTGDGFIFLAAAPSGLRGRARGRAWLPAAGGPFCLPGGLDGFSAHNCSPRPISPLPPPHLASGSADPGQLTLPPPRGDLAAE